MTYIVIKNKPSFVRNELQSSCYNNKTKRTTFLCLKIYFDVIKQDLYRIKERYT